METASEPWAAIFRLFRDGQTVETIRSGWRLSEERLIDLLHAGWRAGETVDPNWLISPGLSGSLFEILDTRSDLSPLQISSLFKGRVSPPTVRFLRIVRGEGRGLETAIHSEQTFETRFGDDLAGARAEILVAAPEVKGRHWRRWLDAFRHVIVQEGSVVFFAGTVSPLIKDEILAERIVIIEKRTHANLVVVDGLILWEGSMNFLLPPAGEEHLRRTKSRLQCDEARELHDLFV